MDFNIVTFHREYNYGAMLQAYGLQEFIKSLGFEAGVFDYIRPQGENSVGLKRRLLNVLCRINKKDCRIREERYRDFCTSFMNLNKEENSRVYVAGSDQVWNPSGVIDPTFFLHFAPKSAKKISYAASLGVANIPEDKKGDFKKYIADFDAISVREERAKVCVSELSDREISVNVDPTLLHDQVFWRGVSKPVEGLPEKYILVYLMHLPKNINAILKWLKKETNLPVVVVDGQGVVQGLLTNLVHHDKAVHRAGPGEFVWLMDHAECVVTSSFHGTAFSLIFQKEFYAVSDSPTSRIANILDICGLSPISENDEQFERKGSVDWQKVEAALNQERAKSRAYFEGVL